MTGVIVPCTQCGTGITRQPWQLKRNDKQFCNRSCYAEWQSENLKGANSHFWKPPIMVNCDFCGKEIKIIEFHANRHERHFCDTKCMGGWQSLNWTKENNPAGYNSVEVPCTECGKITEKQPWMLQRNRYGNFCSRKCLAQWHSKNKSGKNSHFWKEDRLRRNYYGPNWSRQKAKARKRDNYTCQHCGKSAKKGSRALDVHHIKPFRDFGFVPGENANHIEANHIDNLITLCKRCHMLEEHRIRSLSSE